MSCPFRFSKTLGRVFWILLILCCINQILKIIAENLISLDEDIIFPYFLQYITEILFIIPFVYKFKLKKEQKKNINENSENIGKTGKSFDFGPGKNIDEDVDLTSFIPGNFKNKLIFIYFIFIISVFDFDMSQSFFKDILEREYQDRYTSYIILVILPHFLAYLIYFKQIRKIKKQNQVTIILLLFLLVISLIYDYFYIAERSVKYMVLDIIKNLFLTLIQIVSLYLKKFLLDKLFISIFVLISVCGFFKIILLLIYCVLKLDDNNKLLLWSLFSLKLENGENAEFYQYLLYIIIYIIIYILTAYVMTAMVFHFSPLHYIINENLVENIISTFTFIYEIIVIGIINEQNLCEGQEISNIECNLTVTVNLIFSFLTILAEFLFVEIIILAFCGLNADNRDEIIKREILEMKNTNVNSLTMSMSILSQTQQQINLNNQDNLDNQGNLINERNNNYLN